MTEPSLDHVLDLTLENILDRRLQTIIFKKGLACSVYHARQLVTHGHVALDGARVTTPRRIMTVNEEERLMFTPKSALNSESHPARIAASDAAIRASQPPKEVDESDNRFGGRRDGRRRQGGGNRR
jgi:small subunit ribosomal protein S4